MVPEPSAPPFPSPSPPPSSIRRRVGVLGSCATPAEGRGAGDGDKLPELEDVVAAAGRVFSKRRRGRPGWEAGELS